MEFERERIIDLREAAFSYCAIAARVQQNSSKMMLVWKQWTESTEQLKKLAVDIRR